jgi:hypothetical protein
MPDSWHSNGLNCSLGEITIYTEYTYAGAPFNGPHQVGEAFSAAPCVIQAEDFDTTNEAYHTAGGENTYRPEAAVNIEAGPGANNYHIAAGQGDWFRYTVEFPVTTWYNLSFAWANASAGAFSVLVNGTPIEELTDVAIPATSADTYSNVTVEKVRLGAGTNVIEVQTTGGNFDKFTIQRTPYQGTPYNATAFTVPRLIEAEEFDKGGEGISFHELNTTSQGSEKEYRKEDALGVDFYTGNAGTRNTLFIGNNDKGEWMRYSISVPAAGNYDLIIAYACNATDRTGSIDIDGGSPISFTLPNTNGWGADNKLGEVEGDIIFGAYWSKATVPAVYLPAGNHFLTLSIYADFDHFEIKTVNRTPYEGTAQEIPGTIQAYRFDEGGAEVAYHDTATEPATDNPIRKDVNVTIGAAQVVGTDYYITADAGEWLTYMVNITHTSTYTITALTGGNEGKYSLLLDGQAIVDKHEIPATGGLLSFDEDFDVAAGVALTAGVHIIRLVVDEGSISFATITFEDENPVGIQAPATATLTGRVYVENRTLHVEGYSAAASLAVYNLMGQKVVTYNAINGDKMVNLPDKGIYIVRIQDNGKSVGYKVLAK